MNISPSMHIELQFKFTRVEGITNWLGCLLLNQEISGSEHLRDTLDKCLRLKLDVNQSLM